MNSNHKTVVLLLALQSAGCATHGPVVVSVEEKSTVAADAAPDGTVAESAADPLPLTIEHAQPTAAGAVLQEMPPPVTRDAWTRLRDGFMLEAGEHKAVHKAIKKYTRSPRDVEIIFERGDPYFAYILNEVLQRGYPTELALLPFVESGYDPFAYSHDRAAGLWQFIPGTGRMYGLQQDWWYDGRRDVVASTRAALAFLGKLQRDFDGDWLLALAAYNAGSGKVRKAVRNNRKAGKPVDFWHLKLPRETRNYVPRLLAISHIVRQPERYGITLPPLADVPAFAVVDTGGQLDIGIAAELAGVQTDALYRLNPGFNRWATHPEGPHRILIPSDSAVVFGQNLAGLPAEQRLKWVRHKISRGQTLSHIAERYDTTVAVLKGVNQLSGTTIRAGRHLLVPVAARDISQYAALTRALEGDNSRDNRTTYRVRNGDNLWNIARQHNVSVRQVARWNRLDSRAVIRPGQKLVIWTKAGGSSRGGRVRSINYTVRSGDSLYSIAKRYDVTITELRRWNALEEGGYIQPGQRLTLYVDVTSPHSG